MSAIALTLTELPPSEVDAGAGFSIFVTVNTQPRCDARQAHFSITEADRIILSGALVDLIGEQHDTVEIVLTAPERVGAFTWTLTLLPREVDGVSYDAASLDFSFNTKAHATSLAVWGTPSPVLLGQTVRVNAGAKCAVGCDLGGEEIELCDDAGDAVTRGSLGGTPFPGTTALFWTPLTFRAPTEQGRFSWSVRFSAAALNLPHGSASASLGFITVAPPDQCVSVTVVAKETQAPVAGVQVRIGPHRAATDDGGVARIDVPAGTHTISTWKAGYDSVDTVVRVAESRDVRIELAPCPEEDPFAFWRG